MDVVYTSEARVAASGVNVKELLVQTVRDAALPALDGLLDHLLHAVEQYPQLTNVEHPRLLLQCHVVRFRSVPDNVERHNAVLDIAFPCGGAKLVWMPWLSHQAQPVRTPTEYESMPMFGRPVMVPRRSKFHARGPDTQPAILALFDEINSIFGWPSAKGGVNVCWENDYDHGRHHVSVHSDDESLFGPLHDIVACVTGPAVRPCVVAVKKAGNVVAPHLARLCCDPARPAQTARLLVVRLPAGMYVMRGRQFQQNYTHEIPQIHERLFVKLVERGPKFWPATAAVPLTQVELPRAFAAFTVQRKRDAMDSEASSSPDSAAAKRAKGSGGPRLAFPVDVAPDPSGASRTALVQADWLKEHRVAVRTLLARGALRGMANAREDVEAFDEWCLHRTSYTFRCYSNDAIAARSALASK